MRHEETEQTIRRKISELMDLINQHGLDKMLEGNNDYGTWVYGDYRKGLVVRITALDNKEVARYGQ